MCGRKEEGRGVFPTGPRDARSAPANRLWAADDDDQEDARATGTPPPVSPQPSAARAHGASSGSLATSTCARQSITRRAPPARPATDAAGRCSDSPSRPLLPPASVIDCRGDPRRRLYLRDDDDDDEQLPLSSPYCILLGHERRPFLASIRSATRVPSWKPRRRRKLWSRNRSRCSCKACVTQAFRAWCNPMKRAGLV